MTSSESAATSSLSSSSTTITTQNERRDHRQTNIQVVLKHREQLQKRTLLILHPAEGSIKDQQLQSPLPSHPEDVGLYRAGKVQLLIAKSYCYSYMNFGIIIGKYGDTAITNAGFVIFLR